MSGGRDGAAGSAKRACGATVAAPAAVLGGKGPWSARRKMTVVLELLRGGGTGGDQPQVRRDGSQTERLAVGVS